MHKKINHTGAAVAKADALTGSQSDYTMAMEILLPYLPIPTVRVSSAQAHGAAKQYPYWGAVRYQIRSTTDGSAVTNMAEERATSDRRSYRLAELDAKNIAAREGRIVIQTIGILTADEARGIADKITGMRLPIKCLIKLN